MKNHEHITEMETILDNHNQKLHELNELLDYLRDHFDEFNELVTYYHSNQRQEDLDDDHNGLIDPTLKRGVLSEDAIYDVISEYYQTNIKMLELATLYLKRG